MRFLRTFKIWVFFGKVDGFFRKKIPKFGKLFVECVSNGNISLTCLSTLFVSFFSAENQKIFKSGKIGNYYEETEFFFEKKLFFRKKIFTKMGGGAKYAGGSRPSCF